MPGTVRGLHALVLAAEGFEISEALTLTDQDHCTWNDIALYVLVEVAPDQVQASDHPLRSSALAPQNTPCPARKKKPTLRRAIMH